MAPGGEGKEISESVCNWKESEGCGGSQHHQKNVRDQRGGTAMATFGRLSTFVLGSGADYTGLGRWCWQLAGKGGKSIQIVVAYQPCKSNKNSRDFTTCEQHERYFQPRGDFRSPRTIFYEQLVSQLILWKSAGEEIILCGDFNKNVYNSCIGRRLAQPDLLIK